MARCAQFEPLYYQEVMANHPPVPMPLQEVPPIHFPPVDEQLDYLQKGAAEIIRLSDLQELSLIHISTTTVWPMS